MRETEYSILDQADTVAGSAWEHQVQTQAEKAIGEIQAQVLADGLVTLLVRCRDSNRQVFKNVFLEKQEYHGENFPTRVAMTVCREGIESFLGIREIDYVSFVAEEKKWYLAIGQKQIENRAKVSFFSFTEHALNKVVGYYAGGNCQTKEELPVLGDDLKLISDILESMQDKLGAVVTL